MCSELLVRLRNYKYEETIRYFLLAVCLVSREVLPYVWSAERFYRMFGQPRSSTVCLVSREVLPYVWSAERFYRMFGQPRGSTVYLVSREVLPYVSTTSQ